MPRAAPKSLIVQLAECWQMGRTGQSVAALSLAKRLFVRAQGANDTAAMAQGLTQIAWFCLQLGQAEQGLDCAVAAKRLSARCNHPSGQAHAGAIFAWLLLETGLSDEAFEEAEQATLLAETCDDPSVLAFTLSVKACVLMYCRQAHLSSPLLARAIELVSDRDDPSAMALYLTNLGFGQVSQAEDAEQAGDAAIGQHWRDLAIDSNTAAIAVAAACGDSWTLRTALCNGAEYYGILEQPEPAFALLDRWREVPGDIGLRERVHYLYTRGELLTRTGALPEALLVCAEAVALSDASTHTDHQLNAVRRLGDVYEAMGNFREALALQKRFHALYQTQVGEATRRRAHVAEMRLENTRLRARAERLADEAARDGLTGLPNRRSFDQVLASLEGTAFAFAILDLDLFKQVNDRYSHAVGDAVLRHTAEILSVGSGPEQYAFRLGGEEFALLFPASTLAAARARCEAIRMAISGYDWSILGAGLTLTGSIGLAAGTGAQSGADLFALADRRLYAAKTAGRNQLISADPASAQKEASHSI